MMVEEISMRELIEECLERKRGSALERGIHLQGAKEDLQTVCRADRKLLRAALGNMIEAALRYSHAGSVITVGCHDDDRRVHVYTSSDGGAIPFEELRSIHGLLCHPAMPETWENEELEAPLVFLSVVKEIADLHGGNVGVRSSRDKEVTFALYLPRRESGVA